MRSLDVSRYALCTCVAAALLAGCGGSQPPIGASAVGVRNSALSHSQTFHFTGKKQTFKVPRFVTKLTVVLLGAAGNGHFEGRGGRVFAVIPVAPAETLAVFVGGQSYGANGGFNGGASGGMNQQGYHDGFGGGGASDIRENGDRLIDRIVVVGGGGGQGGEAFSRDFGAGGKGGGSIGGAGSPGPNSGSWGIGGGGGMQDSGGLGGSPGGTPDGQPGANGSLGHGGTGGSGCDTGSFCIPFGGGGGGGGGGYYGGGGGGGGTGGFFTTSGFGGGGGGGGSSYIEPSALRFRTWQGWHEATANGLVVISWY